MTVQGTRKEVFSRQYKALVTPIQKYAAPLWSPYLLKNIDALEQVQCRASKYALPMLSRKTGNAWVVQSPIKEVLFILARGLQDYSWSQWPNCDDYFEFNI